MPSKFHILTDFFLSSGSSSLTLLNICALFFLPKNPSHLKSPKLPISALVTVAVPKIASLFSELRYGALFSQGLVALKYLPLAV